MNTRVIQRLAIEAGFDAWDESKLDGKSAKDRLVTVGEYPCGEALLKFVELYELEREKL